MQFLSHFACIMFRFFINLHTHWRQSALNSAGALQDGDREFRGIFTPFYTIRFRGGHKSGGPRATVASPSLVPLYILIHNFITYAFKTVWELGNNAQSLIYLQKWYLFYKYYQISVKGVVILLKNFFSYNKHDRRSFFYPWIFLHY